MNARLADLFSLAFEKTVEGQALDINLRGRPDVSLETYGRIIQLKTAYYLALTWVGGAVVAGVDDRAVERLWELGRCLGPAFQIRDDIIDLTQGKGRGGEIGCDLKEGKPSVFMAFVLDRRRGGEDERRRLLEILAKPRRETTEADVAWAIDFYRRAGALDFAEEEAARLIARSGEVIESLPLDDAGREVFRAISRFMIDRST
jgi:geranylgeranyl pyrophosphate synthase